MEKGSVNMPTVAESVNTDVSVIEEQPASVSEKSQEVADLETVASQALETSNDLSTQQRPRQTPQQNAQFARRRREQQLRANQADEGMQQAYNQTMAGTNVDRPHDEQAHVNARLHPSGSSQQDRLLSVYNDPLYRSMQDELAHYRTQEVERKMAEDLKVVQKLDSEIKSLDDLGPEFLNLRCRAGVDAKTAFLVLQAQGKFEKAKIPQVVGKLSSTQAVERDYYTESELDSLTAKQLSDPNIMAKAMKSMTRLKKR